MSPHAREQTARLTANAWLEAVEGLDAAAAQMQRHLARLRRDIETVRDLFAQGLSVREIAGLMGYGEDGEQFDDRIREHLQGLDAAWTEARVASVRMLHQEGLSMERIAAFLGVTRQRVSAMIKKPTRG